MVNAEWLCDRAHYLITRVAVIKEQISGSRFQSNFSVQDEETSANFKRTTNLWIKQTQEICRHEKRPKNVMSTERQRNAMNTYTKDVRKQICEQ